MENDALSALYPSMTPAPQKSASAGSDFFGTPAITARGSVETKNDKLIDQARDENVSIASISDEVLGNRMYPDGGDAGAPLGDYSHILSNLFDTPEREARLIHDDGEIQNLQANKDALNSVFVDLQVGQSAAGRMMSVANDFLRNPRTSEDVETLSNTTMTELRKVHGSRTDALLQGAKRVCTEISRKVPRFNDLLNSGMGSDPTFIKNAISIAKRRGYC